MSIRTFILISVACFILIVTATRLPALFPARAAAQAQALPALPQIFLNTTYAPPSGSVITVPAGGNFQSALNNAKIGRAHV